MENKLTGLTAAQVAQQQAAGNVNVAADVRTRSIPQIFAKNICTFFNLVNALLAVAVFTTGSYKNMLFMLVIFSNIAIGVFQEVRSKLTIDRLSVLAATRVRVLRDGREEELPPEQLVLGDVVHLRLGDQVPADAEVLRGRCGANEALLTGESDLVAKRPGSQLMAGSFVAAGECWARLTAVGAATFAVQLNNEVRRGGRAARSEIMDALRRVVRWIAVAIVPLGGALFAKQIFVNGAALNDAILNVAAALIGLIPAGLILLTSGVLAVSVVRLAQRQVLVQELYCVETLARVDVVCLDKTGTLTTGAMRVDEVVEVKEGAAAVLAQLVAALPADNPTSVALHAHFAGGLASPAGAERVVPFSSERKYSGGVFAGQGLVLGAAEFVVPEETDLLAHIADEAGMRRALVLAAVPGFTEDDQILGHPTPLAVVFLEDVLRKTAAQTLEFFTSQGVRVNIISGDAPATVSRIAAAVGVPDAHLAVDMSTLSAILTDEEFAQLAETNRVFARVSPQQKRRLVEALQSRGHTVAMTGDGVNDVLAMHAADCSVAMGSGAPAARSIAQLVLLNDDFASMPAVVAEGRRAINNLQRSAALFLNKTLFSAAFALIFLIPALSYPFQPIQLTLVSMFTIGMPSFVLALEPNHERVRGRFLRNVVVRALPGAAAVVAAVLLACVAQLLLGLGGEEFSTLCLMLVGTVGVAFVRRLARPLTPIRVALLCCCVAGLLTGLLVLPGLFSLAPLNMALNCTYVALALPALILFLLLCRVVDRRAEC